MAFPQLLRFRPGTYDPHESFRMRELDGVELASFRRRALAFGLDIVLLIIILIVLLVLVLFIYREFGPAKDETMIPVDLQFKSGDGEEISHWIFEITLPFLYWGLLTYFMNGRTLGKWALGIRVVSLDHERVGFWQSVERAIGYSVSALEFGLGFFQYFLNPNHRTAHDKLAETIVVRERRANRGLGQAEVVITQNGLRYFETGW